MCRRLRHLNNFQELGGSLSRLPATPTRMLTRHGTKKCMALNLEASLRKPRLRDRFAKTPSKQLQEIRDTPRAKRQAQRARQDQPKLPVHPGHAEGSQLESLTSKTHEPSMSHSPVPIPQFLPRAQATFCPWAFQDSLDDFYPKPSWAPRPRRCGPTPTCPARC